VITVEKLYISPVKALALVEIQRAPMEKVGIPGDRAFFLIDQRNKLFTQREHGPLVRVLPSYDPAAATLAMRFPNGDVIEAEECLGEPTTVVFFGGRPVPGRVLEGPWSEALSQYAGTLVRVVKADRPGLAFDGFPLSMCSVASLEVLARAAHEPEVDGRRFRQNIYLSGAAPHQEDSWVGKELALGGAVLRVKMPDPRCVITTKSPVTGEYDLNTLKLIASYRTDQPKQANFGVYCTVVEPGDVCVGDVLRPPG
jgi:uncharacterized protein YcbX